MGGVLDDIGWIQDVIVNERTGRLIDGHLRVELAIKRGEKTVPVKYVDLSEEEEERALATFDPITSMAETDRELLNSLVERCRTDNEQVVGLLQDIAEKEDLHTSPLFEIPEVYNDVNSTSTKSGQYDRTKMPIQVGALLTFVSRDEQRTLSESGFDVFYHEGINDREDVKTLLKQYAARLGDEIRSII